MDDSGFARLLEEARHGGYDARWRLRIELERSLDRGVDGHARVAAWLRTVGPREWITLDESMRIHDQWIDLGPGRPALPDVARGLTDRLRLRWPERPGRETRQDVISVGLASMSRDGRVRQAAVHALGSQSDDLAGPFLVLRTVDWVEEVSRSATTLLTERIAHEPQLLIASAPLVFSLSSRKRSPGIDGVVLDRARVDRGVRSALLASSDLRTRRRVIGHDPVRSACSVDELVALAESDPDSIVASAAGVAAVSRLSTADPTSDVLVRLLHCPPLVRRAVLDALPGGGDARVLAERHLFDRSPPVRGAAQRAAARSGGDPAAIYRTALARFESVPIAIEELAVVGSEEDHATILGALGSPDVATRRAAVAGAAWIAGARLVELLTPLLSDPSPGVTRAAERRLRARARDIDSAVLAGLLSATRAHNRRAALRLTRRRSTPERIEADLIALADDEETIRRIAEADLRGWLQGAASVSQADLQTRRRLGRRLDAVEDRLADETVGLLRFHAGLRPEDLHESLRPQ